MFRPRVPLAASLLVVFSLVTSMGCKPDKTPAEKIAELPREVRVERLLARVPAGVDAVVVVRDVRDTGRALEALGDAARSRVAKGSQGLEADGGSLFVQAFGFDPFSAADLGEAGVVLDTPAVVFWSQDLGAVMLVEIARFDRFEVPARREPTAPGEATGPANPSSDIDRDVTSYTRFRLHRIGVGVASKYLAADVRKQLTALDRRAGSSQSANASSGEEEPAPGSASVAEPTPLPETDAFVDFVTQVFEGAPIALWIPPASRLAGMVAEGVRRRTKGGRSRLGAVLDASAAEIAASSFSGLGIALTHGTATGHHRLWTSFGDDGDAAIARIFEPEDRRDWRALLPEDESLAFRAFFDPGRIFEVIDFFASDLLLDMLTRSFEKRFGSKISLERDLLETMSGEVWFRFFEDDAYVLSTGYADSAGLDAIEKVIRIEEPQVSAQKIDEGRLLEFGTGGLSVLLAPKMAHYFFGSISPGRVVAASPGSFAPGGSDLELLEATFAPESALALMLRQPGGDRGRALLAADGLGSVLEWIGYLDLVGVSMRADQKGLHVDIRFSPSWGTGLLWLLVDDWIRSN